MSEVINITEAGELRDLIETEPILVVKFTAPSWCGPCRQLAPHYEKAAESAAVRSDMLGRATFVSVDLDENDWAAVHYSIRSVPTLMLYRDGQYVKNLQERTAVKLLAEINS